MVRLALVLLLIIVLGRAFWRLVDGIVDGARGEDPEARRGRSALDRGVQMARDPVCGTFVVPDRAVAVANGPDRVYFCSTQCRDKYRAKTA